jgi:hypothetical protein
VSRLTLYLDEHVQLALAEALRARGVDILTTQEAKNIGLDDVGQLAFAAENRRSLFSYDKLNFGIGVRKKPDNCFSRALNLSL